MKRPILLLTALMFLISLSGQVPQGLNYQAVARDIDGGPLIKANLTVRISIYQDETIVWTEDHQLTTDDLGLFSLVIGDTEASGSGSAGSFASIDWGSGTYSIGIEIDQGSGFVDLGTESLQSVPYALYAGNSADADNDPANEIQDLTITGTTISLTNDPTPEGIDLAEVVSSGTGWQRYIDSIVTFNYVGIGTSEPNESSLAVQGLNNNPDKPLFEVRRQDGVPVFSVFNDGVMVYIDENAQQKGVKGGFAVGGYRNTAKGVVTQEYLRVTPDSVRIYVPEDTLSKGVKGGFAVGGYRNSAKGPSQDYLYITPDSIRMYVPSKENDPGYVGLQGGFAVNTYDPLLGQASPKEYIMGVNRGITRFNTTDNSQGFAIGSQGEGWGSSYLLLTPVNTFVGFESGINNNVATSAWDQKLGTYNIFMGYRAGKNNTDGASNLFIGNYAGYNQIGSVDFESQIGFNNIYIGDSAGYNLEGNGNLLIGRKAGYGSLNGNSNLFIGRYAGRDSESYDNIVIGNNAGIGLTGAGSTIIGDNAGTAINGIQNTILGSYAGSTSGLGDANTFLGAGAGFSNTAGSNNLFAGQNSGFNNSGNNNVFLGQNAGFNNTNGTGNIFIGNSAGYNEDGSNKLYIENSSSTDPLVFGDFLNDQIKFSAYVSINTSPDNFNRLHVEENTPNNYTPAIFGQNNLYPNYGIGVEGSGGYIGVVGGALGAGTGTKFGVYGYAFDSQTGNYGVYGSASGTTAYAVYAAGNLAYTGSLVAASDGKLKKDIIEIKPVMENLMKVTPRSYSFDESGNTKSMNLSTGTHYGFVAQELEVIFPELVVEVVQPDDENLRDVDKGADLTYKGVKYIELIPILLKGMQEQQEEIEQLKLRIAELEGK